MNAIGIDGCRVGWFCVFFHTPSNYEIGVLSHIAQVIPWLSEDALILIDIPIGLTDSPNGRQCDRQARKVLSPLRHSSVFSAPCRKAIQQGSYQEGSAVNIQVTGRKLSRQSWGISPKIKEVDDFLRAQQPRSRAKIREIHPEVAFWSLNEKRPMAFNKKTAEGFEQRRNLLKRYLSHTDQVFDTALTNFRRNEVARDDIADALVCAFTALMYPGISSIPEVPEFDEYGLPMEIVHAEKNGVCPRIF